ncbi:ATP-grasp domain-containing protein [Solibacillus silvestris]
MKRLLMLGGSHIQIPAIKTARGMGHYVITCDYLEDNPGHKYANEYYNVSTTDKEGVLSLAKSLKIDGIVCYASDPAAPTAAYVAEQLKLPSHPYKSVEILSNKDLFRAFLKENNFNVPKAKGYNSIKEALSDINQFSMPVMIKPVDSSGSKGVSKIDSIEFLQEKANYALKFSRANRFIIEEFIEKSGYQVSGDGFSVNGELKFRCFANNHYMESSHNLFVPVGASWPYTMPERFHMKIHAEIQRALNLLSMQSGAYNFEVFIENNENIYIMEIGARNGGDWIPQVIQYATDVNMVEYTIKAALGEDCSDLKMVEPKGYWSVYVINSQKNGIFEGIKIDEELKKNIVEYEIFVNKGDKVSNFTGAHEKLGMMILKFSSLDEMLYKMENMSEYIKLLLKDNLVENYFI